MKNFFLLLGFMASMSFAQSQQDSILLLNGKVFKGEISISYEYFYMYN